MSKPSGTNNKRPRRAAASRARQTSRDLAHSKFPSPSDGVSGASTASTASSVSNFAPTASSGTAASASRRRTSGGGSKKKGSGGGSASSRSQLPAFIVKTYSLVGDAELDHIISWSANGQSFVVHQPEELARTVLPRLFKHSNFSSFVRQLNMYNFSKLGDPLHWEFTHAAFVRDSPEDLHLIRRKVAVGNESQTAIKEKVQELTKAKEEMEYEMRHGIEDLTADVHRLTKANSELTARLEDSQRTISEMRGMMTDVMHFLSTTFPSSPLTAAMQGAEPTTKRRRMGSLRASAAANAAATAAAVSAVSGAADEALPTAQQAPTPPQLLAVDSWLGGVSSAVATDDVPATSYDVSEMGPAAQPSPMLLSKNTKTPGSPWITSSPWVSAPGTDADVFGDVLSSPDDPWNVAVPSHQRTSNAEMDDSSMAANAPAPMAMPPNMPATPLFGSAAPTREQQAAGVAAVMHGIVNMMTIASTTVLHIGETIHSAKLRLAKTPEVASPPAVAYRDGYQFNFRTRIPGTVLETPGDAAELHNVDPYADIDVDSDDEDSHSAVVSLVGDENRATSLFPAPSDRIDEELFRKRLDSSQSLAAIQSTCASQMQSRMPQLLQSRMTPLPPSSSVPAAIA